ncbi:TPR repeat protein [Alteromonadaceae bacterium 2753L.S.0a.02]|nr:TPR repeat protein [Alteromonadaceae bacterium 2753L.S.0a.02]
MKYDSRTTSHPTASVVVRACVLLLAVFPLLMSGCSGTAKKDDQVAAPVVLKVLATDAFIPVESFDKDGAKIPYEPAVNPYAIQKGRIQKEFVSTYIEARRAFKSNNHEQADKLLHTLTESAPELSGPWVMLGDISLAAEKYETALQRFQKAIEINPENVNAYLRLAQVQRLLGKFIEAQNTYAAVLAVWKDFPEAHLNLAVLYDVYMNEPLKAQQHMEAYQFLAGKRNEQVSQWLAEIRSRTGVPYSIKAGAPGGSEGESPVSLAGG